MNDVVKNREIWLNALSSGKYKQTSEVLQDSSGFCCLGVACDVYMKETGKGEWIVEDSRKVFLDSITRLPDEVKNWFGFSTKYGDYDDGMLTKLNDDERLSFSEIADIIDSNPKGLFDV